MRLISIKHCQPGMRLSKRIFNEEGLVLLGEHAELTQSIISRLEGLGIHHVYIEDSRTNDVHIPELLSDQTRIQALSNIRSSYQGFMEDARRGRLKSAAHLGRDFRRTLDMIVDELQEYENAMIMLDTIQTVDYYLFQHSLNVCLYTTMLGLAHGYSRDKLTVLGLGALLHDIGKTLIPESILMKPGPLTEAEFNIMRKHTEDGFTILKDSPGIPLISAHCALQHHERLNGSGYPRGIMGDEIHEYAKLIGIVDTYDAMTTHRVYKETSLPHQAVEVLYGGAGTLFDTRMVGLFRDKVAIYPPGLTVILNTGETGVVVDINSDSPHRPVVRMIRDADGQDVTELSEVDLSKKLNIMITSVCEM